MIVYHATKSKFLHDCDHDQMEDVVSSAYVQKTGRYASQPEFKAWRNSLTAMARVLRDSDATRERLELIVLNTYKTLMS